MTQFFDIVIAGILVGGLYGLFSSGLSLTFGITRILNFAHGDFVTVAMYAAITMSIHFGVAPLWETVPLGLIMLVVGYLLYQTVLRRTITRSNFSETDSHNSQMVLTLALSVIIVNALLAIFGPNAQTAQPTLASEYKLGSLYVSEYGLVTFLIAVVIFVLLLLLIKRTTFGKAIRATVDDRDMAMMVGVNTNRVYATSFGVGLLLAGATGAILATFYPVTPQTGENFLILSFVSVILGGLGSIEGAFIAGIFVGVVEQLTATYVALDLEDAGVFVIFVVVLLVRPSGLFGRRLAA